MSFLNVWVSPLDSGADDPVEELKARLTALPHIPLYVPFSPPGTAYVEARIRFPDQRPAQQRQQQPSNSRSTVLCCTTRNRPRKAAAGHPADRCAFCLPYFWCISNTELLNHQALVHGPVRRNPIITRDNSKRPATAATPLVSESSSALAAAAMSSASSEDFEDVAGSKKQKRGQCHWLHSRSRHLTNRYEELLHGVAWADVPTEAAIDMDSDQTAGVLASSSSKSGE